MRGVKTVTEEQIHAGLASACGAVEDPRATRELKFPLGEILFTCLTGQLCGGDSYKAIVQIAEAKLDWMRRYFFLRERRAHSRNAEKRHQQDPAGRTASSVCSVDA